MLQNHIRLNDLLTRNLNIQWFEGVALVQSVCRLVIAGKRSSQDFPPPSEIRIAPDGSVSLIGASTGAGVAGAAHTLAQMLSDDVPVRLRLIVAQATASESSYATLGEFSEALAYFERPDAAQILQQLYARAVLAGPRAEVRTHVDRAPAAEDPLVASKRSSARQSVQRTTVMAATVAVVACATVWFLGFRGGTASLDAALDTLKQRLGVPGEIASPDVAAKDSTGSAAAGRGRRAGRPRPKGSLSDQVRQLPFGTPLAPRPVNEIWTSMVPNTLTPTFHDVEPIVVIASAVGGTPVNELDDDRLYSNEDARVTPPRNVYPKLPAVADSVYAARSDPRTILELIVAADGLVERVRPRTPVRNVHEFMLLSAAKAWRFEPATVDGRPVRFLHRIAIPTP